jgi:DNA replication and repair protein RecF
MLLKKIKIENFRNIKYAELEFNSTANVFYGDNAQGKTNLIEAIAIALGKSFRNIRRNDIIPFDCNEKTKINLLYESDKSARKINEISYEPDCVRINSIPLKKAADLYGEFKYVVFIPDSLNLIKGYPDVRRYYLDNIAIMQNKSHRKFMYEYNTALKQRCAVYFNKSQKYFYSSDVLSVWDDILIKQGINLTYGRLKYLNLIKKYACEIYHELSGGENLEIVYNSDVFTNSIDFLNFSDTDKEKLYGIYKSKLNSVSCEGLANKTHGAHKDDVVFEINNKNAKSYGSQGQLRSIAVALKLAEAHIIRDFNNENPVVLLDEVLGELDFKRREYVVNHFINSQVFITSCNINDFKNIENLKVWSVENGVFIPR